MPGKQGPKTRRKATAQRSGLTKKVVKPRLPVPEYLASDDHASDAWDALVELLAANGNLERTDPVVIEAYAVNVSLLRRAYRSLQADDPKAAIRINSATMRLKAICYDLGLVPATSKYAASKNETGDENKWGDLLGVVG